MRRTLAHTLTIAICLTGILVTVPACTTIEQPSELYAAALDKSGKAPMEYLAGKIRTHYLVAIGEDHWIKDHPQFMCDVIRTMALDSTTNIDYLAVEFGNQIDQPLANEFIASPTYRHDLVVKILQNTPDDVGNPYQEYADIFRTVWQSNQAKPTNKRTQILLLDPEYILKALDGESYTATHTRDEAQMMLLRNRIVEKQRGIFYCGLGHVASQMWGQYLPDCDYYYNWPSAGFLLKATYPDQVCLIGLWGGLMGSNGYIPTQDANRWQRLYNGVLDEAFERNGNRPAGFDLDTPPFDTMTVARVYTSAETYDDWDTMADKGAPWSKTKLLRDHLDGIVFFRPVSEFSGATVTRDIYEDEAFVARVSKRNDGQLPTRKKIYEYIRTNHPILSESLDALIAQEDAQAPDKKDPAEGLN